MKTYSPSEILKKVAQVAAIYKDFYTSSKKKKEKGTYPEYYLGYNRLVKHYDAIRVHSVYGVFPENLLGDRSPNMTAEEFEYVRKNYKQVTLPVFIDYLNSIGRAFNDANWSIEYAVDPGEKEDVKKAEDASFRQYVEEFFPVFGSLENWVKNVLPAIKSMDANGVIAVRPAFIPTRTDEVEQDGELIEVEMYDETVKISPALYYYNVKQIVAAEDDNFFLILTKKKSEVYVGNKKENTGLVFEFYDSMNIWEVRQVGKKEDYTFEIYLYYEHACNFVPVTRLYGVPVQEEDFVYFQSPFLYAVDNLDLVALNSSNLQLAINNSVYPVKVMVGNECDFIDDFNNRCIDGTITDLRNNVRKTCPSCNGSGLKTRLSPSGTLLLKPRDRGSEGDAGISDPLKFVSPDVSSLDFLESKISKDESKARNILHLNTTGTEGDPMLVDVTATGKTLDQKALYSFIKPISNQMFNVYEFILEAVGVMREGQDFKAPALNYPQAFEFKTESDYLNDIATAINNGLPPFVVYTIIYRYLNSIFFTEGKTSDAFALILEADRLLTMSDEDISVRISGGTIAKWEEVLHSSAMQFIKELVREDEAFFELELAEQVTKLQDLAKAKAAEIKAENPVNNTEELFRANFLGEAPTV